MRDSLTEKDIARFHQSYTRHETGCFLWSRALTNGYGGFKFNRTGHRAHRIAWLINNGPIPDGLMVCHKCDVRNCVNPDHLFLGTALDNNRDMMAKGRFVPPPGPPVRGLNSPKGEDAPQSKLTNEVVFNVRADHESGIYSQRELAKKHGIPRRTIRHLINKTSWKHI